MKCSVYQNRLGVVETTSRAAGAKLRAAGFVAVRPGVWVTSHVDVFEAISGGDAVAGWRQIAAKRYEDSCGQGGSGVGALYPFQVHGVDELCNRDSLLLADEMGLGKTVQVCAYLEKYHPGSVLIVCPASLKRNWADELERWTSRRDIEICSGRSSRRIGDKIVIINYSVLWWWRESLDREWDLVVIDEAHMLKSRKAKRTEVVCGFRGRPLRAKKRVALTGTPITSRIRDLWTVLRWLDPYGWDRSYWAFAKRFCAARKTRWGWDDTGASDVDLLNWRLRSTVMVRRTKKDVLKDLPKKLRKVVVLDGDCVKIAAAQQEMAGFEEVMAAVAGVEGVKVNFTEMSEKRKQMGIAKLPQAVQYIRNVLEEEEKVVVFFWSVEVGKRLAKAFSEFGVRFFAGETSEEQRDAAVREFQNDKNVRVFVGQLAASGVGLTLTAARVAVFVEQAWEPTTLIQAEDRLHRIGQQDSVLSVYLVADGSIDRRMVEILSEKEGVMKEVLE